jgi:WD40 repeat protein
LDIDFNLKGDKLVTGSSDSIVRVYNVDTSSLLYKLKGHNREVTKTKFNPQGDIILSTGFDGIGRIWDVENGKNISLLEGHDD